MSEFIIKDQQHATALGSRELNRLFPVGSKWSYLDTVVTVLDQGVYRGGRTWYAKCSTPSGYKDGYPVHMLTPAKSVGLEEKVTELLGRLSIAQWKAEALDHKISERDRRIELLESENDVLRRDRKMWRDLAEKSSAKLYRIDKVLNTDE